MRQNRLVCRLTLAALLLCSAPARAEDFIISNTVVPAGKGEEVIQAFYPQLVGQNQGPAVEQQLNASLGDFAAQLSNTVNARLNGLQLNRFMGYMANASAATGRLMSADYGTDPSMFTLSVGAGTAVNNFSLDMVNNVEQFSDDLSNGSLPPLGGNALASVLLGINLRAFHLPTYQYFDWNRLTLFANVGAYSRSFGVDGLIAPLDFKLVTFGLHGLYRLVNQHVVFPYGMLRWGGVMVGTGFNYQKVQIGTTATLPDGAQTSNFSFRGQTLATDLNWTGEARLNLRTGSWGIPLEVSTHVQLLYIWTVWLGVAGDLNFGSSSFTADANQPVTITLRDPASGRTLPLLTPTTQLDLNARRTPTVVDARAFVGSQLNFGVVALFGQSSIDTARNLAASFGLRAFW